MRLTFSTYEVSNWPFYDMATVADDGCFRLGDHAEFTDSHVIHGVYLLKAAIDAAIKKIP